MALDNVVAIVDVVDFAVQDYSTRDLLFPVDYAESIGLKTDAEKLEIKGGIGAPVRIVAHHSKTGEFNSQLPLVDLKALGTKLGKATVKGVTVAPMFEKKVVATSKITLSQTPKTGTLKVYVLEANGRDVKNELTAGTPASGATEYSISGKDVTVNTAVTDGTLIECLYDYDTGSGAQLVRVSAKDFAGYCRITGRGYALDESGHKSPVSFIVYKCQPTPEFEMTFKTGEATNIPFNCTMMADLVDGELVFFDIIPLGDESFN